MDGDLDDTLNLCACWNSNAAMQRLLSILRHSQAYCTDNECLSFSELPNPGNASSSSDNFITLSLFAILGLLLYMMRPSTLRQSVTALKNRDNEPGSDGDPPLPPPSLH